MKVLKNKFLDVFTDDFKMVNKPRHISGSLIGQACIKKTLMKEFLADVFVGKIYFSYHDAVRITANVLLTKYSWPCCKE